MKTLGTRSVADIQMFPDTVGVISFAAGTGQSVTPPAGTGQVLLSADVNFWIMYRSTAAAAPTTSSTATSTNSELITAAGGPVWRNLQSTEACTVFSVVSATTGFLSMSFYNR